MIAVFVMIMPIRTYFQVKHNYDAVSHQVSVLTQEAKSLSKQMNKLDSSQEIQSIAHQRYGLIKPNQEEFVVLPTPKSQSIYGSVPSGSAVPTTNASSGKAG
jgi:cell division protein FtsB